MVTGIGERSPRLRDLWVDAGYRGATVTRKARLWRWQGVGADLELRPSGFQLLPHRRAVERTFAWLGRSRRLSKDYEALPATAETWIHLAMSTLMLVRLAK